MDDELMTRLKLEEEMSAICGDFKDDDPVFAFNLAAALEDDDQGLPASGAGSKKVVLEEWPEILEDNLGLRIKKFKDHAVKRKGVFKTTEDRLLEEKCAGHEKLALSYLFCQTAAAETFTLSSCLSGAIVALYVGFLHGLNLLYCSESASKVFLGFRGEGLGFRGEGLGFGGEGLGFRGDGLGFRGEGLGLREGSIGFRREGLKRLLPGKGSFLPQKLWRSSSTWTADPNPSYI